MFNVSYVRNNRANRTITRFFFFGNYRRRLDVGTYVKRMAETPKTTFVIYTVRPIVTTRFR